MIFYLVADHPEPSWGTGMLYEHVRLLREQGRDACVLHHQAPYRPSWRDLDVPVRYLDEVGLAPTSADIVVVPEVLAAEAVVSRHPWRRVVFVQGSFLILAVLPHGAHVVERHFGLPATVVPPFIAPYFFGPRPEPRLPRVLLAVKEGYRLAGVPDGAIAATLLARELAARPAWSLLPLSGCSHREVAELMKTSMFLVNVNSHEAFNTTVPEAMAAGCIPICYEAGGGRDFLLDGDNAIVFANQEVYALVEKVSELVDRIGPLAPTLDDAERRPWLTALRRGGERTAAGFRPEATARALAEFFARLAPP
jgi:Glycosyl transferases group 1